VLDRLTFLAGSASTVLALAVPAPIGWAFPGAIAAYARRVDEDAPFVTHDARTVMPAASIVKVLILLAVIRKMEATSRGWNDDLSLRKNEIVGASETFAAAMPGERATLQSLARAAIEQSDNTAANVLADWVGFEQAGIVASDAGLSQTELRRHFMDFAQRGAGIDNTTTARDMGLLLCGIARGTATGFAGVSSAGCRRIVAFMLACEDRDTIPAGITRAVRVANKTGELEGVRHDVAIVGLGSPGAYVVALLSSDVTNRAQAMVRMRTIAARIDALSRTAGAV
jgi:beta-lactamase class A